MVEVVRRPRKPNLLVQVTVAVVSGAAAMYCIQNIQPLATTKEASTARSETPPPPSPPPPKAEPVSAPAEGPTPDPDIASNRVAAAPPAANSMMIVPEPGGASGGVVAIGEDAPVQAAPPAPPRDPAPKPDEEELPKKAPTPHLTKSALQSRYVPSIGSGFESSSLTAPQFAQAPKPKPKSAPAPVEKPKEAPHFIVAPKSLNDKPIQQEDVFVPSLLHPEIVPERPFWDNDRKRKAALTGLIAITGFFYLLFVMGVFNSFLAKPKYEEEPPP
jgi:hypothetical protein